MNRLSYYRVSRLPYDYAGLWIRRDGVLRPADEGRADARTGKDPIMEPQDGKGRDRRAVGLSREQLDDVARLAQPDAHAGMSKLQIMRTLPPRQRLPYLLEHYGWPLGLGTVAAAVAVFLLVRLVFPAPEPQLYVAVMDQAIDVEQSEDLRNRFSSSTGVPADDILVDAYFDTARDGITKLQTLLSADDVDVIIAPERTFATLAGYGYLVPLDGERRAPDGADLASFRGYDDSYDDDIDRSGSGMGAELPYGVRLDDAGTVWDDVGGEDDAVAGLAQDSERADEATRFLGFITDKAAG